LAVLLFGGTMMQALDRHVDAGIWQHPFRNCHERNAPDNPM
jgi:hypothetical protein